MGNYNINYPLRDDVSTNTFFQMTKASKDALSADLLTLLLTQPGERYYNSDFGTNLLKFIFEPNDVLTAPDIEAEIKRTVSLYIPALKITSVTFNWNTDDNGEPISDNQLNVNVKFTFNENNFSEQGSVDINF